MEAKFLSIFDLARPYLDTRDNELHTRVACRFARRLLDAEGGDENVVLPAVILHDIGWKTIPEELHLKAFGPGENDLSINRIHEVEGARLAREILEEFGYDSGLADEIAEIILGHDSRKEALSVNDAVVKDSDKLWRFSEEALEVDPPRFGIPAAVHAEWLKHQIDKWFITDTGRTIARAEQHARALTYGAPLGHNAATRQKN
jgi:HD superfamily phosphodiesterase